MLDNCFESFLHKEDSLVASFTTCFSNTCYSIVRFHRLSSQLKREVLSFNNNKGKRGVSKIGLKLLKQSGKTGCLQEIATASNLFRFNSPKKFYSNEISLATEFTKRQWQILIRNI